MPRERLRETIERLRSEIDSGADLSEEQLKMLSRALKQVEEVLDADPTSNAPAEDEDEETSLLDRLREAEQQFEESHPNLTHAVGAVANALSQLGI